MPHENFMSIRLRYFPAVTARVHMCSVHSSDFHVHVKSLNQRYCIKLCQKLGDTQTQII